MENIGPSQMQQKEPEHHSADQAKLTLYGVEIVEKKVSVCNKGGRIYLPLKWLGKKVKIVRVD